VSVASAAGPFTTKKYTSLHDFILVFITTCCGLKGSSSDSVLVFIDTISLTSDKGLKLKHVAIKTKNEVVLTVLIPLN
jgi:hypothetical protein